MPAPRPRFGVLLVEKSRIYTFPTKSVADWFIFLVHRREPEVKFEGPWVMADLEETDDVLRCFREEGEEIPTNPCQICEGTGAISYEPWGSRLCSYCQDITHG